MLTLRVRVCAYTLPTVVRHVRVRAMCYVTCVPYVRVCAVTCVPNVHVCAVLCAPCVRVRYVCVCAMCACVPCMYILRIRYFQYQKKKQQKKQQRKKTSLPLDVETAFASWTAAYYTRVCKRCVEFITKTPNKEQLTPVQEAVWDRVSSAVVARNHCCYQR